MKETDLIPDADQVVGTANPVHEILGEHYIIELHGCPEGVLDNQPLIRDTLLKAAELAGATVVNDCFHKFSPQGVSGVVVIAESHLSIHTWPERGYAALDFFTCKLSMPVDAAFECLRSELRPEQMQVQKIERG